MRRSSVALGSLAVALILSACGDRDSSASRLSAPGGSLAAGNPNANPNLCDFGAMKSAARDYVGSQDVITKTLVGAMQTAYGNGGNGSTAAATPKGLDILAEIAKARLTARQIGTNAQGAILVNAVVSPKCSDIQAGVSATTLGEFNPEKALGGGVFEVRGGGTALAAVAFNPVAGGGRVQADPKWGIIPATDCPVTNDATNGLCSWPAFSDAQPRYLLTAYPTSVGLGTENPAITTALGAGNNGFVVGMMPDIPDKTKFLVGLCISPNATDGTNIIGGNLGFHDNTLLAPSSSAVCSTGYPTQVMLDRASTWYASLANRAASWLSPSPAWAQSRSGDGDWVGPTGWSPVGFAVITGTGTSLKFTSVPKNGTVAQPFVLKVSATSAGNHPIPGVLITIDLANNSGSPAGAVILNPPAQGTTGPDGVASIAVSVNKAGGYTFLASGALRTAPTNTTVSTTILNVKNK